MEIQTIAAIGLLFLLPAALFAGAKTIYHMWFVLTGVRRGHIVVASLLGPLALLIPSLFEERAQLHLRRLNFWLPASLFAGLGLFLVQSLAGALQ